MERNRGKWTYERNKGGKIRVLFTFCLISNNNFNTLSREKSCFAKLKPWLKINFNSSQLRFTTESESRVDYNQMMSYPSIIANRWLAVRLEVLGSFIVLFACLFAVLARETINPAIVGLSISAALQVSQVLSFLVRMTAEVETNIVAIERGL